jgi:oxygen-independent coproporphyrinogen III oxidase
MNKWEQIQGIYIHIPFCLQKCLYCDFASFPHQSREIMGKYTDRLCQEIQQHVLELPVNPQATIYFGGGTPTVLPMEYITKIVKTLKSAGLWENPAEATIEANPGTISRESLLAYRKLGFDRISFGIQSLKNEELKAMGRIHSSLEALEAINFAKEAGFSRINADLIYGYPGQTLESITNSLQILIEQGIKHLSVYGLVVEDGTHLCQKLDIGELTLPSEDDSGDMYDFIVKYLPQRGYKRYEISNYAFFGEESLHNMVYWQYLPYLGFGVSACSFNGKMRSTNTNNIAKYLQGKKSIIEDLELTTRLEEYIFMGLRTSFGINFSAARKRFNLDIMKIYEKEITECQSKGLLKVDDLQGGMNLTELGMRFGNQVFEKFL